VNREAKPSEENIFLKKRKKSRAYEVTPQRIGITEHNPTQNFGKKKKVKTQTTAKGKGNNDIR
jgi:hypothetical protein